MTNGSFYRGDEIVGLTLRRSFLGGRGEEQHCAPRASEADDDLLRRPRRPLADGRPARERRATVDMAIEATGAPTSGRGRLGLRARAFVQIPVRLDGHADAPYRHALLQDDPQDDS